MQAGNSSSIWAGRQQQHLQVDKGVEYAGALTLGPCPAGTHVWWAAQHRWQCVCSLPVAEWGIHRGTCSVTPRGRAHHVCESRIKVLVIDLLQGLHTTWVLMTHAFCRTASSAIVSPPGHLFQSRLIKCGSSQYLSSILVRCFVFLPCGPSVHNGWEVGTDQIDRSAPLFRLADPAHLVGFQAVHPALALNGARQRPVQVVRPEQLPLAVERLQAQQMRSSLVCLPANVCSSWVAQRCQNRTQRAVLCPRRQHQI